MRAMLEELGTEVRPEFRPAVEEELARLEATVMRSFAGSVDLDRAHTADPQGIGGRTHAPGAKGFGSPPASARDIWRLGYRDGSERILGKVLEGPAGQVALAEAKIKRS
jgi:hypothetical protein